MFAVPESAEAKVCSHRALSPDGSAAGVSKQEYINIMQTFCMHLLFAVVHSKHKGVSLPSVLVRRKGCVLGHQAVLISACCMSLNLALLRKRVAWSCVE